jgi:hypothetical protein
MKANVRKYRTMRGSPTKDRASLTAGQQRMLAQTLARKFGVPYANQVDRLVAAMSGGTAKTP